MDKIRVSAKTMEEAITKATIQLHTTSDRISYTVLIQGSKGILGIGAKPWIIEAFVKENVEQEAEKKALSKETTESGSSSKKSEEKAEIKEEKNEIKRKEHFPEKKEEKQESISKDKKSAYKKTPENYKGFSRGGYDPVPLPRETREKRSIPENKTEELISVEKREFTPLTEAEIAENKEKIRQFLSSVLSGMDMDVELEMDFHENSNELYINLVGPDMGILIGKRGQTLDSLQYLCSLVLNKEHKEDFIRVKLDTEDYRKRREQTLRSLAKNIAYKVKKTRKPVNLEPMNPYERRIIHASLQNDSQVSTKSEGDDPFRHVVIFFKNSGKFRSDRKFKNKYPKENRAEK